MPAVPSWTKLALLLGVSFFFGLAFEEFYRKNGEERPGGIRTFPLLAIGGGALYLLDTQNLLPFTAGLLVLGASLFAFYRDRVSLRERKDEPNAGLIVPLCNVHAYLLGAVALAFPAWIAVGVTVASVLILTGRERLHDLASKVEMSEIVTAGQFLILTGLVLPLLPDQPVTTLTHITPRQAWLALLAVCSVSYASYLVQRVLAPSAGDLWMAVLGGLYSSTATTVVLARRARTDPSLVPQARAGITLATAVISARPRDRRGVQPCARQRAGAGAGCAGHREPDHGHRPISPCALLAQTRRGPRAHSAAQSARARHGRRLHGAVRGHFAGVHLGRLGVRPIRHSGPRGGGWRRRHRPFRAEPRAGRRRRSLAECGRGGDPGRHRVEQSC